jgi:hypothetical protein
MFNAHTGESTWFAMTELEEKLIGADHDLVKGALLSRLDKLAAEIAAHQRAEPSPRDYAQAEVIGNAIAAARKIVIAISPLDKRRNEHFTKTDQIKR